MQKRKLLTRCLCQQKALLTNSVCALFEDHSHVAFLDPCQYLVLVTLPVAASPLVIVPSRETARGPLTRTPMNWSYILASVGESTAPRLLCLAPPVPGPPPAIGAPSAGLPGQGSSYIIRGHAVHAHWTECMDRYADVCSASPGHPHPLLLESTAKQFASHAKTPLSQKAHARDTMQDGGHSSWSWMAFTSLKIF